MTLLSANQNVYILRANDKIVITNVSQSVTNGLLVWVFIYKN